MLIFIFSLILLKFHDPQHQVCRHISEPFRGIIGRVKGNDSLPEVRELLPYIDTSHARFFVRSFIEIRIQFYLKPVRDIRGKIHQSIITLRVIGSISIDAILILVSKRGVIAYFLISSRNRDIVLLHGGPVPYSLVVRIGISGPSDDIAIHQVNRCCFRILHVIFHRCQILVIELGGSMPGLIRCIIGQRHIISI